MAGRSRRLGIHRRTVQRWLNAYLEQGLDGLRPRKAKGAPAKIPDRLADEVRRWVIEGPAEQGLDRANWTHAELADHRVATGLAQEVEPLGGLDVSELAHQLDPAADGRQDGAVALGDPGS